MLRVMSLMVVILAMNLSLVACETGGASADEKEAALQTAMDTANTYEKVGENIIEIKHYRGKLRIVIEEGVHPIQQREFMQDVAMKWYEAYPEDKKPKKAEMLEVWIWEVEEATGEEVGFMQVWSDQYDQIKVEEHHYQTQNVM